MNKNVFLLVSALLAAAAPLAAGDRFQASLAANALFPADSAYRETYGGVVFFPELKAAYAFSANFSVWAGCGFTSVSGETPTLKEPADSRQNYLALGGGYNRPLAGGWTLFGELGLANIAYREEALGKTVSGSTLGMVVNAGARRDLGKRFLLLAQLGYVYGKKTIEDVDVKMGGFKAGIGAGVRL